MPLFPEPTGFVEECLTSVGIMLDDNIPHQQLFELAIHVKGEFSSFKQLLLWILLVSERICHCDFDCDWQYVCDCDCDRNCDRNCDCDCNFITV